MPVSAGTGTNPEAQEGGSSSGQLPVCRENGTLAPPRTQTGHWGKSLERPWSSVCWACTLPASTSLFADDPTANCTGSSGQGPCAMFCYEVIRGKGVWAQSPLVSMAVTEAGVEEREVVAEVLSRAGLGTLQSADRADDPLPPGSSGRPWLWGLWPCRFWPQRRWCRSQSLCWQKEPQ